MFCVIYHLQVKPLEDEAFKAAWHRVTESMVTDYGSLGARLHVAEDGSWIAYAQWRDRQSWESGHVMIEAESRRMHVENLLEEFPRVIYKMQLVEDLLTVLPVIGLV